MRLNGALVAAKLSGIRFADHSCSECHIYIFRSLCKRRQELPGGVFSVCYFDGFCSISPCYLAFPPKTGKTLYSP